MRLRAVPDKYQPRNRLDGMPQGEPDGKGIVEWFDKQLPTWERTKRIEWETEYFLRSGDQSSPEFWKAQWRKYAPVIFRIGSEVEWVHAHVSWRPYHVDGIQFGPDAEVRFVILRDKNGSRWQAFPEDLRTDWIRPEPRTGYTNEFNRPDIGGGVARWCKLCRCWDVGLIENETGRYYQHADEH
ncbi:hypothetical protein [Streptomyces atratus]|uniref:hypothetical protein n=1 Tax=Streptomyces atratus TaxID=1893 RepID=UPI0036561E10